MTHEGMNKNNYFCFYGVLEWLLAPEEGPELKRNSEELK
jgi:hypothetical protein